MGNGMIAATFFQDIWNGLCSTLYAMFSILFRLMDWIQSVFRALVGLEPMKVNGTIINDGEQKMDVVFHLIQTDIVQDIFWSMVTFSLILMFIMTFIAIIRNSYQDKPKPIGTIIGDVFKGLVGMILIPVACFAGLMFGNVILQAVDAGTSFGSASTLSETLFMASAYDANIARDTDSSEGFWSGLTNREENYQNLIENTNFGEYLNKHGASNYNTTEKNEISVWEESDWEKIADHIDDAFTAGAITYNANGEELDLYDPWRVNVCYNMGSFNFIIMLVGGCTMIGFLFKMCFGLITRMFKLVFDFVLIPVVLAMMPFDGGKATGTWKGDFVKNVTLSYGTIGAINLFYSILPIANDLEFTWGHGGFFTAILKLVMVIIGLFSAEKLITTVTGWFGIGDLIGEGKSAYDTFKGGLKKVTDPVKKGVSKGIGMVAGAKGAYEASKKHYGDDYARQHKFGTFLKGAYGATGLDKKVEELNIFTKSAQDGQKAGKEFFKTAETRGVLPIHMEDYIKERTNEYETIEAINTYEDEKKKINKMKTDGIIDDKKEKEMLQDLAIKTTMATNYLGNEGEVEFNLNGTDYKWTKQQYDTKIAELDSKKTKIDENVSVLNEFNVKKQLDAIDEKLHLLGGFNAGDVEAGRIDISTQSDEVKSAYLEYKNTRNKIKEADIDEKIDFMKSIGKLNDSITVMTDAGLKKISDLKEEDFTDTVKNNLKAMANEYSKDDKLNELENLVRDSKKESKDLAKESKEFKKSFEAGVQKIMDNARTANTDTMKKMSKEPNKK